jgi:isoamylase
MLQPRVSRGAARPLGASLARGGINFSIFSRHATQATLVLFDDSDGTQVELPLDPRVNRTGDIWHVLVRGVDFGVAYCWRFDRKPNSNPKIHRYDSNFLLLDPYAQAIVGGEEWGFQREKLQRVRRCIVPDHDFDWENDQPLNIPLADSIIYEMHVRGFTQSPTSGVEKKGTFAGLIEKIPYLQSLGVTAVELLPVNEFEESDTDRFSPFLGTSLVNLWGYQPIGFFAPNSSYAWNSRQGGVVREFKELVKAMHKAGIEVILDVVFNHTCEGDERGPRRSFRGIDNSVYYIIDPVTGHYLNYTGCGNTFNCNHPVVRRLISDCLQYWVTEMHVDGFRFDLASVFSRAQDGSVLSHPPLLEELATEPVLAKTKLIAEAWDAAGLYQVGTFPAWGRWAEWNGRYRDDVRRFWRGDPGMVSALATRLLGSADLYQTSNREPFHSINFVTCHDGFTLRDLVSYNHKHNEANGENNHDGANDNHSWNHGVEGETDDPSLIRLRLRQQRNFAATLLLSHGVPMLLAGDELNRTQNGNNNAYCQDNEISWIDWSLAEKHAGLLRFFRNLIAFRRSHSVLRPRQFAPSHTGADFQIVWHGRNRLQPDWGEDSRSIGLQLIERCDGREKHLYLFVNGWWEDVHCELPQLYGRHRWGRVIDTNLESPLDIADPGKHFPLATQEHYRVAARSLVLFEA